MAQPFSLQEIVGNQGVVRLFRQKLDVSQPGDPCEQEAEQVAQRIESLPFDEGQPLAQTEKAPEGPMDGRLQPVRLKAEPGGYRGAEDNGRTISSPTMEKLTSATCNSTGDRLSVRVRRKFEGALGTDLSAVRVHTGVESADAAKAIHARAFTKGNDIHFNEREYDPDRPDGRRLLAHEIAHTLQQQGGVLRAPDSSAPAAPLGARTALVRSEQIRAAATVRLGKIAAYNSTADTSIAAYREMRLAFAQAWGAAWERHSGKLLEGNEQAAAQNLIEGIVIGATASVLAATAGAAIFPAAAAAKAFTATWFAFNVGANVAGSVGGAAISTAVGRPSVPAATSGKRDQEADAWQAIAQVESTARIVASLAPKFGLELGNAEYCIAQVQAHIDDGTRDMTWDQTLALASTLANWDTGLTPFDEEIDAKLAAMSAFGDAVAAFQVPAEDRLEIEIWRAWMSTLSDSSDEALDQDVIQRHLVKLGLIPDYFYMSDADQHRAVAEARASLSSSKAARSDSPPSEPPP